MPSGSISYEADSVPLARPSAVLLTFRYDPEGRTKFQLLPNVQCLSVQWRKGSDPPAARFRYIFQGPEIEPDFPRRLEQVYPLDAHGKYVVLTDDRLVVAAVRNDGYHELIFDGFVQVPQGDLSATAEMVTFTALGTPIREFDTPLGGAIVRDANAPATSNDYLTDLPARFNPDGKPNASPEGVDSGESPQFFPVFLGPVWPANEINAETIREWTLPMACRYVITVGNRGETYVDNGDTSRLDTLLKARAPKDDDDEGAIDSTDSSTYTEEDIEVQDIDVTGSAWPDALVRLIEPHGFGFCWVLKEGEPDENTGLGEPSWSFVIWREDTPTPVKQLKLQRTHDVFLDPALTNLGGLSLARDTHDIANQIALDAAPIRYEASFVLAPGFAIAAADATTLDNFKESETGEFTGANRDKYRLFIFDECGEGHWDFNTNATVTTQGDLQSVVDPEGRLGDEQNRKFVHRRRPATGYNLISTDDKGKPLRAFLQVSNDYSGEEPGVWDASTSAHWQMYTGLWHLLEDRLGVLLLCHDPNSVEIKTPTDATFLAFEGQKLNIVEQLATPTTDKPRIRWRLTCCVDSDLDFNVVAPRRFASPTKFVVTRRVDARDRFRKTVISKWSAINTTAPGEKDVVVRDDEKEAKGFADGTRRSREAGKFAGPATILRFSTAYQIGDKINRITGRGLSLQTNVGTAAGEGPIYPAVIGISWNFDGEQTTTLELTDHRAMPAPKRRGDREIDA